DDDDVVPAIDMRCVNGFVLALEASGDEGRETPDDKPVGIDHDPLFLHLARLGDVGFHGVGSMELGGGMKDAAEARSRTVFRVRRQRKTHRIRKNTIKSACYTIWYFYTT